MMNNVVFKIFTLVSSAQGLGYIQDMKIGHYMVRPSSMDMYRIGWANCYFANGVIESPTPCYFRSAMYGHPGLMANPDSGKYLGHGEYRRDLYPECARQCKPSSIYTRDSTKTYTHSSPAPSPPDTQPTLYSGALSDPSVSSRRVPCTDLCCGSFSSAHCSRLFSIVWIDGFQR